MLRREVQALKTQLRKAADSAAQSTCQSSPHVSVAEANGQPSSFLKPDSDADKSRKGQSTGAADSGLPSPSLPATPHSPADSPRGAPPPVPPYPPPHVTPVIFMASVETQLVSGELVLWGPIMAVFKGLGFILGVINPKYRGMP